MTLCQNPASTVTECLGKVGRGSARVDLRQSDQNRQRQLSDTIQVLLHRDLESLMPNITSRERAALR